MTLDTWVTVEEAMSLMMARRDVNRVIVRDNFLCAMNEYGAVVEKRRIYDGTEHRLAKIGMVCL